MTQLTKNFSLEELAFTDKKKYQQKNLEIVTRKHRVNLTLLAHLLQPIRDLVKRPVVVTSGYRYYWLNRAVRGAKHSQHRYAEAVDFVVRGDHGPEQLERVFLNIKDERVFDINLISQCIIETRSGKKGDWQWIHLAMITDRFRKSKKYRFEGPQFLWTINGRDYQIWE